MAALWSLFALAVLVLALLAAPAAHGSHSDLAGQWHLDQGATGASDHTSMTRDSSGHDMLAGTFDGATVRFYLDGVRIGDGASVPGPITYVEGQHAFRIGRYGWLLEEPCAPLITSYVGDIDEVRIYRRALSAAEIKALADPSWTTPPPVGQPPPGDHTPPHTTITLDHTQPAAGGYYPDQVRLGVSASDDLSSVETRCALDPATPPARFDDLPQGCNFLSPLIVIKEGTHTVYAPAATRPATSSRSSAARSGCCRHREPRSSTAPPARAGP